MIYLKSMLKVIDNSWSQPPECIKILKKESSKSSGIIGDRVVCVIRMTKPLNQNVTGTAIFNRVKRGHIYVMQSLREQNKRMDIGKTVPIFPLEIMNVSLLIKQAMIYQVQELWLMMVLLEESC